jgi:hypothetical protein
MGTDTKGFVLTSCKDVFFVCDRVQSAINRVIHPLRGKEILSGVAFDSAANRVCSSYLNPSSSAVRIDFMHASVSYSMHLHFTCDCDNTEFGPQSISLSLGAHHESAMFMKRALESLSMLGQLYFKEKDGYGTQFTVLEAEPTTFLKACATDEIPVASQFPLMDWKMMHRRGDFGKRPFDLVVGLAAEEIEAILDADYDRSRVLIEEHVKKFKAVQSTKIPTSP